MLKSAATLAKLCAIWKLFAVEVIVKLIPAQIPEPACEPRTTTCPAAKADDLQRDAVIVGAVAVETAGGVGPSGIPLAAKMKAPRFGMFVMLTGTLLMEITNEPLSLSLTANAISS